MTIDPGAVGLQGGPVERSWTSNGLSALCGGGGSPLDKVGEFNMVMLHTLCDSNPARFKSMADRFSRPVIPGDILTTSMWVEGNTTKFQTRTDQGDIVLDRGRFTFEE